MVWLEHPLQMSVGPWSWKFTFLVLHWICIPKDPCLWCISLPTVCSEHFQVESPFSRWQLPVAEAVHLTSLYSCNVNYEKSRAMKFCSRQNVVIFHLSLSTSGASLIIYVYHSHGIFCLNPYWGTCSYFDQSRRTRQIALSLKIIDR